jgi:hypothetical protein
MIEFELGLCSIDASAEARIFGLKAINHLLCREAAAGGAGFLVKLAHHPSQIPAGGKTPDLACNTEAANV